MAETIRAARLPFTADGLPRDINKYLVQTPRRRSPTRTANLVGWMFVDPRLSGGCARRRVLLASHPSSCHSAHLETIGLRGYLGTIEEQRLDQLQWGELKPGTKIGKAEAIFPRLDKAAALAKLDEFAQADRERDKPKEALKSVQTEKNPEAAPEPPSPELPAREQKTRPR